MKLNPFHVALILLTLTSAEVSLNADTVSPKQEPTSLRGTARNLSASVDIVTMESVRTYNGHIPLVTCQIGYFRPQGNANAQMMSGQRRDGCRPCGRGRYGSSAGCTACPKGTYNDRIAGVSVQDCHSCPPGTYGNALGLMTSLCSASCPTGFYSDSFGNTAITSCKACPLTYQGWQCIHDITATSAG